MKKFLKGLGWFISIVLIVIIALLLTHPLWVGVTARKVAEAVVPGQVGADFKLAECGVNGYTGKISIGGMELSNPAGYNVENAIRLGKFAVDIEPSSLMSDVIHIRNLEIRDVAVSYVKGDDGIYNFDRFALNAVGPDYTNEVVRAEAEAAEREESERRRENESQGQVEEKSKRVVIDRLVIANIKVNYCGIELPVLPEIVLTDIGKQGDGMNFEELGLEIWNKIISGVGISGDALKKFGGNLMDLGNDGANSALDTIKGAGDTLKGAGDTLKGAGDAIRGFFK